MDWESVDRVEPSEAHDYIAQQGFQFLLQCLFVVYVGIFQVLKI